MDWHILSSEKRQVEGIPHGPTPVPISRSNSFPLYPLQFLRFTPRDHYITRPPFFGLSLPTANPRWLLFPFLPLKVIRTQCLRRHICRGVFRGSCPLLADSNDSAFRSFHVDSTLLSLIPLIYPPGCIHAPKEWAPHIIQMVSQVPFVSHAAGRHFMSGGGWSKGRACDKGGCARGKSSEQGRRVGPRMSPSRVSSVSGIGMHLTYGDPSLISASLEFIMFPGDVETSN